MIINYLDIMTKWVKAINSPTRDIILLEWQNNSPMPFCNAKEKTLMPFDNIQNRRQYLVSHHYIDIIPSPGKT